MPRWQIVTNYFPVKMNKSNDFEILVSQRDRSVMFNIVSRNLLIKHRPWPRNIVTLTSMVFCNQLVVNRSWMETPQNARIQSGWCASPVGIRGPKRGHSWPHMVFSRFDILLRLYLGNNQNSWFLILWILSRFLATKPSQKAYRDGD